MIEFDEIKFEEKIKGHLSRFREKIQETLKGVASDLYCDCLPHLEFDLMVNVENHSRQVLNDLLNGWKNESYSLSGYEARELRKIIYRENKEEVEKAINKDLLKQVEDLNRDLKHMKERYEKSIWI